MLLAAVAVGFMLVSEPNSQAVFAYDAVKAILSGESPQLPTTKTASHGVFITIESQGKILACRGALEATEPTLEQEILSTTRSACQFDPRYHQVRIDPGKPFNVTITIVRRQEAIDSVRTLQPKDGLVLRSSSGVGVVLPWEGRNPDTRLSWAYRKAKTPEGTSVSLKRLIADRYRYPEP
ncbi:MAG: AMMECR1 domain-containing protein [Armatimonadetes bacterium]|nr:AMMECR1 domain-containing protein [Armatimonadota bacterium]